MAVNHFDEVRWLRRPKRGGTVAEDQPLKVLIRGVPSNKSTRGLRLWDSSELRAQP